MPTDFTEDVSEENICKALCLTGVNVVPDDLHACYRMKRLDRAKVKFKCCQHKYSFIYKCKNLGYKSQELTSLKFSARLFVINSSRTNGGNLKVSGRFTWFFINVVNLKLTEHGRIHKYFHATDIENLLEIDNLEEYTNSVSF